MPLSTKLTDLRVQRGISLQQVADEVDVTKSYMWELEKGKRTNPSVDVIQRIADFFKVSVEFLLDQQKSNLTQDDAYQIFYRELKSLSPEDQDLIQQNIKLLRDRAAKRGNQS